MGGVRTSWRRRRRRRSGGSAGPGCAAQTGRQATEQAEEAYEHCVSSRTAGACHQKTPSVCLKILRSRDTEVTRNPSAGVLTGGPRCMSTMLIGVAVHCKQRTTAQAQGHDDRMGEPPASNRDALQR